jgi:hypothetical protein
MISQYDTKIKPKLNLLYLFESKQKALIYKTLTVYGRARKIRTSECLGQSQMPYRLAIALSIKDYTLFYRKKKIEATVIHRLYRD